MKCQIGSLSDEPCPHVATHQARDWGYGPGSDELEICEHHAREALSGGTRVLGPEGDEMRFDDDRNMVPA